MGRVAAARPRLWRSATVAGTFAGNGPPSPRRHAPHHPRGTISLLIPELVAAQQVTATLPAGTTIRVTAPQALTERTTGAFQAARSDSLWLQAGRSRQLVIPVAAVERLEVSKGRARLKWALIGAGSGAVAGFILGGMAGGKDDITGTGAAAGAIAGTAQGVVLGAIGGALLAPRRWVNHPVSALR